MNGEDEHTARQKGMTGEGGKMRRAEKLVFVTVFKMVSHNFSVVIRATN